MIKAGWRIEAQGFSQDCAEALSNGGIDVNLLRRLETTVTVLAAGDPLLAAYGASVTDEVSKKAALGVTAATAFTSQNLIVVYAGTGETMKLIGSNLYYLLLHELLHFGRPDLTSDADLGAALNFGNDSIQIDRSLRPRCVQ